MVEFLLQGRWDLDRGLGERALVVKKAALVFRLPLGIPMLWGLKIASLNKKILAEQIMIPKKRDVPLGLHGPKLTLCSS